MKNKPNLGVAERQAHCRRVQCLSRSMVGRQGARHQPDGQSAARRRARHHGDFLGRLWRRGRHPPADGGLRAPRRQGKRHDQRRHRRARRRRPSRRLPTTATKCCRIPTPWTSSRRCCRTKRSAPISRAAPSFSNRPRARKSSAGCRRAALPSCLHPSCSPRPATAGTAMSSMPTCLTSSATAIKGSSPFRCPMTSTTCPR